MGRLFSRRLKSGIVRGMVRRRRSMAKRRAALPLGFRRKLRTKRRRSFGPKRRFSKRRRMMGGRRRGRRSFKGRRKPLMITLNATTMTTPPPLSGIDPTVLTKIPCGTCDATGLLPGSQAEAIQSGTLGSYSFDFSRFASMQLSAGSLSLAAFRSIRFGRGHMSIRRIDTGGTTMVMTDGVLTNHYPINLGNRPVTVRMHYLRLSPGENTSSNWDVDAFLADPRRKTRILRPGRKIRFSFAPLCNMPGRSLATASRQGDGVGGENVILREFQLPGKTKRLGWLPTGFITPLTHAGENTFGLAHTGIGPDRFRIVGSTLMFMFDSDMAGNFQIPLLDATTMTFQQVTFPLVHRVEGCRFTLRGLRLNTSLSLAACPAVAAFPTPFVACPINEHYSMTKFQGSRPIDPVAGPVTGVNVLPMVPLPLTAVDFAQPVPTDPL